MRHLLAALALGLATVFSTGCLAVVGAGAAAGTMAYLNSELKSIEDVPLDTAYQSTQQAFNDLGFSDIEAERSEVRAKVNALDLRGKKVAVNLEKVTEKTTRFRIRVGALGDEQMSIRVLRRIREEF